METKAERPQSHEDRETQKRVKRIEQRQASEDGAREAETKERSTTTQEKSAANERFETNALVRDQRGLTYFLLIYCSRC
jgi:hypothetical protein